ncbi:hypothetical protein SKAU_G00057640 [Synaphobranchus kaupii]|uniref:Uncharacterized protein n=1 Tax=Synaphobranchus kaupii TaxID=118154 RepID=A0A9Q1G482_SYNKA|nr:hypothetical protein SKAU_G00057640 [Synaphobranchus kaupii]
MNTLVSGIRNYCGNECVHVGREPAHLWRRLSQGVPSHLPRLNGSALTLKDCGTWEATGELYPEWSPLRPSLPALQTAEQTEAPPAPSRLLCGGSLEQLNRKLPGDWTGSGVRGQR